jgi:hypothetical protein
MDPLTRRAGRKVQGTRIVAVVFQIGIKKCRLAVIRPDTEIIGYGTHGQTAEIAIAKARADGVNVSNLHAMKEWPRWAQRTFFKAYGWETTWKVLGWALVKPAKVDVAA